jgi:glycosyltransferase involved in cell wall biosynthesis
MTDLAVIMSVYQNDRLDYLKKSVQSILTQTYSHFDFFICFDGPVLTEIEEYITAIKDYRIKVFRIKINGGLAKALNYLLEKVLSNPDYKLIARMDADDISVAGRFELQRLFLLNNPSISCVGSWYQEIDESENVLSNQKLPVAHYDIKKFFLRRSPLAHPSVMFRRTMIENAGYYPTNTLRLEDYVFWSNCLSRGLLFANIPEYLLKFRRDKNFYKRRSGLRFGFNYIKVRFKINRVLKASLYIYFYSVCVGIIRMMPSFVLKQIYHNSRKANR